MPRSGGIPFARVMTLDVADKPFRVEFVRSGITDNTKVLASVLTDGTWYVNTKGQGCSTVDFSITNLSDSDDTLMVSYDNGQFWNEFGAGGGYTGPARLFYFTVKARGDVVSPTIRFQITVIFS